MNRKERRAARKGNYQQAYWYMVRHDLRKAVYRTLGMKSRIERGLRDFFIGGVYWEN